MKQFLLFTLALTLFAACSQASAPQRANILEGAPNFRDLGGYTTIDGKETKWRILFRSQKLSDLTDADEAKVRKLGIKTVIDFRDDSEVAKDPSRLPENVKIVRLPMGVASSDSTMSMMNRLMSGALDSLQCVGFMEEANRRFVTDFSAQYTEFFKILLDKNNYPIVFHCTAGKDRTGFAAAMALSAVGVPWETVLQDYLLTNEHLKPASIMPTDIRAAALPALRAMGGVQPAFLNAAKETIIAKYGSIDNYLEKALGVGAAEKAELKKILLK